MTGILIHNTGKLSADILSKIHQECFSTYWDINEFNNFFSVDGTHALLVSQEGVSVGMMVYRISHEQADIITIAVLPDYRRQGLAKALLEKALAHIASLRATQIFLDVEDGNIPAQKLYETHGFTVVRRRKLYYRKKDGFCTDALVMSRKLA